MVNYVTGISGSGKSYLINKAIENGYIEGECISLDHLVCKLIDYELYKDIVSSDTMQRYIIDNLTIDKKWMMDWDSDSAHYIDNFLKWLEQQDGTFWVEGIQIYNGIVSFDIMSDHDIYLINSSLFLSAFNRLLRAFKVSKSLREFGKRVKHNVLIKKYHIQNKKMFDLFVDKCRANDYRLHTIKDINDLK